MTEGMQFSNPHEELTYLRSKVLEAERRQEQVGENQDRVEVIRDTLNEAKRTNAFQVRSNEARHHAQELQEKHGEDLKLEEMLRITEEKGVFHALAIIEKLRGWRLEDDFHDYLIDLVSKGLPLKGAKEKGPVFRALHMTLYEVVLPKKEIGDKPLSELLKGMEQLYAGLLSVENSDPTESNYMAFEFANPEGTEDTRAFVAVPSGRKELFERQTLSIFPDARLLVRERDYNIFNDSSVSVGASARLSASAAYPVKTYESFSQDPLNVILNGFSKLPANGSGAALQIIFRPANNSLNKKYEYALNSIKKGKKASEVLREENIALEVARTVGEAFFSKKKDAEKEPAPVDEKAIEWIGRKLESPIIETNIRLVVSAPTEATARELLHNFQSAFNQFENSGIQSIKWSNASSSVFGRQDESDFYRAFTFRLFRPNEILPLNLKELSTILHFHTEALSRGSTLKQSSFKTAPPPIGIPESGTLIGYNEYQGQEKKIYMSPEDRLRHLYVIGQTGTGKTSLLKNMIVEDMRAGEGVCFIDPHGSDIQDILGLVPPDRIEDVVYFDPASTERPMALNMLEYDTRYPEQKTFVVNEMLSIFNKLFDMKTAGGPMFEQYFRNAVLLTIDDPSTGSTLVDVSRLLSNKSFREQKLARCTNPLVVQFWTEVAGKAGGEGKLENVVPYIVSKFDNFLSNDIMRPVIGQQHSTFNFREIMDNKKILLVNLSKGRLGEMNANLIGLILVGKILMAALSRADSVGQDLPPFYLYIDEFQNITTDSISAILSEARKYKLSLNIAHQFIAQIDQGIRDAVFGNVGSMAVFRVGTEDAEFLEKQYAPTFTARDIMNIDNFNAYFKPLVGGVPATPFNIHLMPKVTGDKEQVENLKRISSMKFGRDKAEVDKEIMEKYRKEPEPELIVPSIK
jgi:hypothetical protein